VKQTGKTKVLKGLLREREVDHQRRNNIKDQNLAREIEIGEKNVIKTEIGIESIGRERINPVHVPDLALSLVRRTVQRVQDLQSKEVEEVSLEQVRKEER